MAAVGSLPRLKLVLSGGISEAVVTGETLRPEEDYFSIRDE